jgi:Fur family ferric uptake transcriptional regulator
VREHGHLHCSLCHRAWEIGADEVACLVKDLEEARGFSVDLSHLSVVGICGDCRDETRDSTAGGPVRSA